DLVAEGLAAAGGHDDERVAPVDGGADGFGLHGAQGVEPPVAADLVEDILSRGHRRARGLLPRGVYWRERRGAARCGTQKAAGPRDCGRGPAHVRAEPALLDGL